MIAAESSFRDSIERAVASRKYYDIATDTVRDMTEAEVIAARAWLEGIPHAK